MKKYGLIGESLVHSFSQSFFTNYFQDHSLDATYENVELASIDEVVAVLKNDFSGLNVTIPYKEAIIPFLDDLSDDAREIGAVNTVQFKEGRTIGHNTDTFGFQQMIKPFLTSRHERAMILGTGGASKAVYHVLNSIGLNVIFISRQPKAENQFSYKDVNELMIKHCKVVVNTTPVGTYPDVENFLDLPYEAMTNEHLAIDLIYNPAKTVFLSKAEEQGATILNGETMLKEQALKAWKIWNE